MKIRSICLLLMLISCNNNGKVDEEIKPKTGTAINEEASLKALVAKYPDSSLLKENLVQYYRMKGDFSNALLVVDSALYHDSSEARLWNMKAVLHFENNDTLKAIGAFEKAVSLLPDPQNLVSLGTLYAQTKNPLALKLSDKLLTGKETARDAYFIKGLYFSFSGRQAEAISFFDKCLNLNFTYMDAYREKAIALYDLGKFTEALAVLDKAITLQNNFDEGYYYSGRCLEKLNRREEAIQSYKNALLLDPEYTEAKEALEKLGVKQ